MIAPRLHATAVEAPRSLPELMALAVTMELEAAERYSQLADAMEVHNNRDVAQLFRRMAGIEAGHARQIMAAMKWDDPPPPPQRAERAEAAETAPADAIHYLMQPYQALEIALVCERRAERFFEALEQAADGSPVRDAARELREEEREHVALVLDWMAKYPKPASDWADDPDPPRVTD